MRHTIWVLAAMLLGVASTLQAQTPQELFNQALVQERAAGNLEQAIQLYERAARESVSDRALAAQSLMAAARSYQKLGQAAESRRLYQEVLQSYSDQKDLAELARQYLADTGTIQGIVVHASTGAPVPEAKVWLSGGPVDPGAFAQLQTFFKNRGVAISAPPDGVIDARYMQYVSDAAAARNVSMTNPGVITAIAEFEAANDARFVGRADSVGRFVINNVLPGRYTIRSLRDGYFPLSADTFPAAVVVHAGRATAVEVPMARGATITGKITDAAGLPQTNVTVQAFAVTYRAGLPTLEPAAAKSTNDEGEYRLFWLTPGEYLVAATPGIRPDEAGLSQSTAAAPRPDGGYPPAPTYYPGTPDVGMAIPVFVRGESPVSGIDVQIRKIPTFHVKGTIRSNVPRNTTYVTANYAIRRRDANVPDTYATPVLDANLPKAGDGLYVGEFDLKGVPPGVYNLRAWVREQNPDGGSGLAFASADVQVVDQDITGVVLDIHPNVRVTGTVSVDGRAPGAVPTRVYLQADGSAARAGVYQGVTNRPVLANSQNGGFMIGAVPTGRWRALLGPGLPPDYYLADVRQGAVSVFDSGFDVGKEPPTPLEVIIRSGARTVEGVIRDAAGKPVAGATAVLAPPRERRLNRALYYTARSDAAGRFRIQGVAPGNYILISWQNMPEGAYFNDRFISRNEDAARRVNVSQSSAIGADIVQIPAAGR